MFGVFARHLTLTSARILTSGAGRFLQEGNDASRGAGDILQDNLKGLKLILEIIKQQAGLPRRKPMIGFVSVPQERAE
ncbi:hypothetical protein RRG08_045442 [Elysia crispata]|uniref:Uncharacterized protein n=1 Tax=Elysia crispata TaxID=231223 RepID=A0AAE1E663_9GAST|nr:hypothetical protein RRG08_045442 [Elysia crispata]